MPQHMRFSLNISPHSYQSYYQGRAKMVHVTCEDGRSLQFPAAELLPFVAHDGVQGRFEISFNDDFKLVRLRRLQQ